MKEYLIGLGLDGSKVFSGLKETIGVLEQVENKSGEVGKTMDEAFSKGVKASEEFDQKTKSTSKNLELIRELAKGAGKDLIENLSGKNIDVGVFQKKIETFKKSLNEIQTQKTIGVQIDEKAVNELQGLTNYLRQNFEAIQNELNNGVEELAGNIEQNKDNIKTLVSDIKNIEDALNDLAPSVSKLDLEEELKSANKALQEEEALLRENQEAMKGLSSASKDLAKNIQNADKAIEGTQQTTIGLNSTFDEVYNGLQPLTTRLGELEDRLYELKFAGQENTAEFRELQAEAIRMRQTIQEVDAGVDNFAKSSGKIDAIVEGATGLVGAFTAVQGAVGLLAGENEELEEALLKVNSAMAILQGLQAVSNALNKDSAFYVTFLRNARVANTTATVAETGAIGANTVAVTASTVATTAFGFALKAIGIGLIITAIAILVDHWDDLTAGVKKFLPEGANVGKTFDKIKSYALGVGNAVLQYVIAPLKAVFTLIESGGDIKKSTQVYLDSINVVQNFKEGKRAQDAKNADKYRNDQEQKDIDAQKRELERRRNRGADTYVEDQKLLQRQIALKKKENKDFSDLQKEFEDNQDKRTAENNKKSEESRKKASEEAKKRSEEAKKKAEEAEKKRLEDIKKQNEQIEKFAKELRDAEIENIEDQTKRERAKLEQSFDEKIKTIEKEKALTKKAEDEKIKILEELNEAKIKKLAEFDQKATAERAKLELEANEQIQNLKKDSLDKELELLKIDQQQALDAINEKYKNEESLRLELIEATEKNVAEKEKELKLKYGNQQLKEDEERARLNIELASTYASESEETEYQKQLALLKIKAEFAQKALDLLIANGADENSIEVLNAKKVVKDAQKEVAEAVEANENKDFDFLDFLGIGKGMSQKERDKLKEAINESMQVLSDFASFMIDNIDDQMAKKQEQIEQTQNEIDELKDKLDEEKELRDNGFANNVELIEAEIAEKERQKEEQIRQEEELLNQKKNFQQMQLALDSVSQLSSLITASTNIFEGFSSIPIVGIPLAIAMIATMFGAFTASKIKASQAISQQTVKHRDGGLITGRSHEAGGEKYYNADGSRVKELEDGEYVVKKKAFARFGSIVESANAEDFSNLSVNDYAVAEMFRQMGFDYDLNVGEAKSLQLALLNVGYSAKESKHLSEISSGIAMLVEAEQTTPKSWFDGVFDYVKTGNKITKSRRKPISNEDQ